MSCKDGNCKPNSANSVPNSANSVPNSANLVPKSNTTNKLIKLKSNTVIKPNSTNTITPRKPRPHNTKCPECGETIHRYFDRCYRCLLPKIDGN